LIIDTAGRLHVDEQMMTEIRILHTLLTPTETLFVVDAMTGQDAVNTAKAFNDALAVTGVILTKMDGDARGGAALSIRQVTGKPIKFIGVGEKADALEAFYPDRMASRILGMGDVLGLIENIESNVDREKTQAMAKKVMSGKGFTLDEFKEQLKQMMNMGGMGALLEKMPGMSGMSEKIKEKVNDKKITHMIAIIDSMTPHERQDTDVIKNSHKRRIAQGAGRGIQEVNRLLKQYNEMQHMMRKMGKGGMGKMLAGMRNMMPGGFKGMPFQ
jgi:signal recognition particle subunit SRP54